MYVFQVILSHVWNSFEEADFHLLREDLERHVKKKKLCNRLNEQHFLCPHPVKARKGLKPYSGGLERSTQTIIGFIND